jgi:hypothetical protein
MGPEGGHGLDLSPEGTVLEGGEEGVKFAECPAVDRFDPLDEFNAFSKVTLVVDPWHSHRNH